MIAFEMDELFSDELARQAVFTPDPTVPGTTVDCLVIVEHDAELRPDNLDIGAMEVGTTIQAVYADVGVPAHGSTFAVEGTTYRVARIDSNDRLLVKAVVNEVT
jgi:hypothetical protein